MGRGATTALAAAGGLEVTLLGVGFTSAVADAVGTAACTSDTTVSGGGLGGGLCALLCTADGNAVSVNPSGLRRVTKISKPSTVTSAARPAMISGARRLFFPFPPVLDQEASVAPGGDG